MNAFRNLVHAGVLALWAITGILFSLKVVFGIPVLASLFTAFTFWLWFAGLAAVTTFLVRKFESALAPLFIHAAAFVCLAAIPRVFPLSLLRLGLDLLSRA